MKSLAHIIKEDALTIVQKIDFRKLNGKTLLLTGASGLIGTYILATLGEAGKKGAGIKIIASTGHDVPEYLKELAPGVMWVTGDLAAPETLAKLPSADYIIHAAGYGQPGRFMEDPLKTIELNTTVTLALLKKLKKGGSFLFISTSEVYSGLSTPPFTEEHIGTTNTTHPRACYIEGKRCGEATMNAARVAGVDAKSARLALAYGPGTKRGDKRVLNAFIEKALAGRLELLDAGAGKRTYCYVADAVEILFHILLSGKEALYNVGGAGTVTIAELAKTIAEFLKVPIIFPKHSAAAPAGAPDDVRLDMTKAEKEFGKTDYVPLDQGLARTIEWQKALYRDRE